MRREIVGIGSLVAQEQSWRVVYARCGHGVQFSQRAVPTVEEAERLVRECLATCQECAQPARPPARADPVRQALRDFWRDQQTERWPPGQRAWTAGGASAAEAAE